MKKTYYNIHFHILEENFPYFYAIIEQYPIVGMEEKYDEIMVCFESNFWNPALKKNLTKHLSEYIPEASILNEILIEEENWMENWEKETPAIIVSERISIAPDWKSDEVDTDIKIIINPKMSFGTGQHSTTKMVCQLLESVVKQGDFWIDAGTGTGVLAILALKLGASKIFAFDNDEWSINNSIENFQLNDIKENFILEQADIFEIEIPKSQGIVANLFVNILKKTAEKFYRSLIDSNGDLILSGILVYDADDLIEDYQNFGFQLIEKKQEFEWVALHFKAGRKI